MSMDGLKLKVLRAICRVVPPSGPPRAGSVPDDDTALTRAFVCGALQQLQEAGEIENWTVLEASLDFLEVSVVPPGPPQAETLRFDRSTLQELATVMDVMES